MTPQDPYRQKPGEKLRKMDQAQKLRKPEENRRLRLESYLSHLQHPKDVCFKRRKGERSRKDLRGMTLKSKSRERRVRESKTNRPLRGRFVTSHYLISTSAPTASSLALISSASFLLTPSLIGFGGLSTRSFASFKPRPVMARTSLITWSF